MAFSNFGLLASACLLVLCSLPLPADSIYFTGYSNWTDLGKPTASGVDRLEFSQTSSDGISAVVGANATITSIAAGVNLMGENFASQGGPHITGNSMPETGASLMLTIALPASSGNFILSGFDTAMNDDGYGTGIPSCFVTVSGGSGGHCSEPTFQNLIQHSAGTPINVSFGFSNFVATYRSAYHENFDITLAPATAATVPEPGTLALFLLPLLGIIVFKAAIANT